MSESNTTYYLFIAESGDHGLTILSPDFPIFLLCGVLMSQLECPLAKNAVNG